MGVQLFGDNYINIRDKFIIPLVNYGINRKSYEYWGFKDVISNNILSLNKLEGKSIEIELSKSDYYKGLHCDIEMFINKSFIQYSDFIHSANCSTTWSFVTLYYFAFFNATCFLRFLNRGFLFLNKEQKKRFEDYSLAVYSTPISLESGNYFFSFKEINTNGNVVITLTFKGDNFHKMKWIQLESTLRELIPACDKDETAIYKMILSLFSSFSNEFPSMLRNKLNYNGDSSILDFEHSLPRIDLESIKLDFIKGLFKLKTEPTFTNKIIATAYIGSFLLRYNKELYNEYAIRSGLGRDFSVERQTYLKRNKITV